MKFKHVNGNIIENLAEYLKEYLKNKDFEYEIYIGSDSTYTRNNVANYAIVVAVVRKGRGVHLIYKKEKRKNVFNMQDRLWWEVEYSVQVAQYLRDNEILTNDRINAIHIDINTNKKYQSNKIYSAATGYVSGMGFEFRTKPDAFIASYAADMLCRKK